MAAVAPIIGVLIFASVATAVAQRRGGFGGGGGRFAQIPIVPNAPYDGRFTFVRVRYGPDYGFASQRLPWSHDYPAGEQHFMKIVNELSLLAPRTSETNILTFDDPQLFKYPVAYLCEPGGWTLSDQEAVSLRTYLQKGGFMIVDDFRYQHWGNFEYNMSRVFPDLRAIDLTPKHPIFHTFLEIDDFSIVHNYYDPPPPIFRAYFEGNDDRKRMMVMVNYNTDISEYWEFSDTGRQPISDSNEAFKIGVNEFIYGITH